MDDQTPVVINVRYGPFDRYIGRQMLPGYGLRGSMWGNPYKVGRDGTLAEVLVKYEAHVRARPRLMASLHTLAGQTLGCWCAKPGQTLTADDELRCHGQVLARLYREVTHAS